MQDNDIKKTERNNALDGLKGLSIITIILYYFFQHIFPGGYLAVNTFLFIAGFLNFRHFYKADVKGLRVNVWQFYKRRISRLFFPMLAMILTTASFILLFARDFLFNLRSMGIASLTFLNNFYQIINEQSYFVMAANPSAFTHLWYVAILGQLIILTPILVKLFYSWHRKSTIAVNMLLVLSAVSAIALAYLYQPGEDPTNVYYNLITRAFAFTFGGAVGLLFPAEIKSKPLKGKTKWILNGIGLVVIVLLFLMIKFMYGTQPFAYRFGMTIFTILSALLLFIILQKSTIWHKVVGFKPLALLGKRSYSYYLWFYPIYLILPSLLSGFDLGLGWTTAIQFIVLIIMAEISYQLFEQKRISLPLGQDFNWRKTKKQFKVLQKSKNSLLGIKLITLVSMLILVSGVVGLAVAPENDGETATELQELIQSNQQVAEDTKSSESESDRVINNIEGLSQQELLYANGMDVTFFGDSILLSVTDQIKSVFPKAIIEADVGLQLYNSIETINQLKAQDLLQPTVVVMLGSNGTFTSSQVDDLVEAIGSDRQIFFITSNAKRNWVPDANAELVSASQRHGNVQIIDWATYASNHPEYLRDDSAHPTVEGAQALAKFVAQEVYRLR